MAKRAAIYLRVSTDEQTTANQERALREVAARSGHEIVAVYRDEGISGSRAATNAPALMPCTRTLRVANSISLWRGRSIGSDELCKT
jgi:DNA invertase Pin-like site-specific DNA recombinase